MTKRAMLIIFVCVFAFVSFYLNQHIMKEVQDAQQVAPPVTAARLPQVVHQQAQSPEERMTEEPLNATTTDSSEEASPTPSPVPQKIIYEMPTKDVILVQ